MSINDSRFIIPIGTLVGSLLGTAIYCLNHNFQPWITPIAIMIAFGVYQMTYLWTDWVDHRFAPIAARSLQTFIAFLWIIVIGITALLGEWLYTGRRISNLPVLFLIDDSGSISQHAGYEQRKNAVNSILDHLDDTQEVGLIVFEDYSSATRLMPLGSIRGEIDTMLAQLSADGATNINSALECAHSMLRKPDDGYRKAHIIIITDGALDDNPENQMIADQLYENGCIISGIFIGPSKFINGLEEYIPEDRRVFLEDFNRLDIKLSEQLNMECSLLDGISRNKSEMDRFFNSQGFGVGLMSVLGLLLGFACFSIMGGPRTLWYLPVTCAIMAGISMFLSKWLPLDSKQFVNTWLLIFIPSLPLLLRFHTSEPKKQ